jgi:hypothetical protein
MVIGSKTTDQKTLRDETLAVYLLGKIGHVRYRREGELENAGGEGKMARLVEQLR